MENKQNTTKKQPAASRFAGNSAARSTDAPARKPKMDDAPRKPSGFGSTAQGRRPRAEIRHEAPAEPSAPDKKAARAEKKRLARREKAQKKRRFPILKLLLILLVLLIAAALALLFIRAGSRPERHMPTIKYEIEASFAPDNTPIPTEET